VHADVGHRNARAPRVNSSRSEKWAISYACR